VLAQSRRHRPTGPSGSRVPGQSAHRITRSGRRRKGRASRLGGRILRHLTTADQPVRRLAAGAGAYHVYYLVPCLNEELVIGATIASLLADPQARVVVVDDASDDRTAELAGAAGPGRVLIVGRALPAARKGKGPALNAGFAVIQADVERRTLAPEKTIVCVMDADGRLSAGALHAVLPLFDDPEVGGVQLAVRIRNGADGLLPRMQDALFLGLSAAFQLARVHCGTVSLGGNGQFTRLSALLSVIRGGNA
jgi:1,2-diacylglycerol 3-beta-glucosyltransferase